MQLAQNRTIFSSLANRRGVDPAQVPSDFFKYAVPTRIEIDHLSAFQTEALLREFSRSGVKPQLFPLMTQAVTAPEDGISEFFALTTLPDFFGNEINSVRGHWQTTLGSSGSQDKKKALTFTKYRLTAVGDTTITDEVFSIALVKDASRREAVRAVINLHPATQFIPGLARNVLKDLLMWMTSEHLPHSSIAFGSEITPANSRSVAEKICHPEVWNRDLLIYAAFFQHVDPHTRMVRMLDLLLGHNPTEVFVANADAKGSVQEALKSLHLDPATRPVGFIFTDGLLIPCAYGAATDPALEHSRMVLKRVQTEWLCSGEARSMTTPALLSFTDPIDQEISIATAAWGREIPPLASALLSELIRDHELRVDMALHVLQPQGRFPGLAGARVCFEREAFRVPDSGQEVYFCRTSDATFHLQSEEGLPLQFTLSGMLPPFPVQPQESQQEDDPFDDEGSPFGLSRPSLNSEIWSPGAPTNDPLREVSPLPFDYEPREEQLHIHLPGSGDEGESNEKFRSFEYLGFEAGYAGKTHIENSAIRESLWQKADLITSRCELGKIPSPISSASSERDMYLEIGREPHSVSRAILTFVPVLLPKT